MIEIVTKAHGKMEISEDSVITIPEGLFGFEKFTKYAIVDSDYEPFLWLQSMEDPNLAFLIVDPFLICSYYEPPHIASCDAPPFTKRRKW